MKKLAYLIIIPFFAGKLVADTEFGGKARVETENFIVMADNLGVARKVGRDIERRRAGIARILGISAIGLWRPRCKIYIYENMTAYRRDSGCPSWSSGCSRLEVLKDGSGEEGNMLRSICTFERDYKELFSVISHELAHVIFRDAMGPSSTIPLWLDEGAANFIQEDGMDDFKNIAKKEVKRGSSIPLTVLFPEKSYPQEKILFYAESASVVDMMINTFGNVPFLTFARLVTGGVPSSRALNDSYSSFTGDIDEFEEKWKMYVIKNY